MGKAGQGRAGQGRGGLYLLWASSREVKRLLKHCRVGVTHTAATAAAHTTAGSAVAAWRLLIHKWQVLARQIKGTTTTLNSAAFSASS